MFIRIENVSDQDDVRGVNRIAFGQEAEAQLVDDLRNGGYASLSLVAEENGQIVGNIMFSILPINTSDGIVNALALAPMAVDPEHQRKGIG